MLFHCTAGYLEDFLGQLAILNEPRYIKPSQGIFRAWPHSAGGLGVVQMANTRDTRTLIKDIMSHKKTEKVIIFLIIWYTSMYTIYNTFFELIIYEAEGQGKKSLL